MTPVHRKTTDAGSEELRKECLREISRYKSFRLPHLFYYYMQARKKWRQLKFRRTYRGATTAIATITQFRKCRTDLRIGIKKYRELRHKLTSTPTVPAGGTERRTIIQNGKEDNNGYQH